MSKIKNGGLDQYGVVPFEQQQFGTTGVEGVNLLCISFLLYSLPDDGEAQDDVTQLNEHNERQTISQRRTAPARSLQMSDNSIFSLFQTCEVTHYKEAAYIFANEILQLTATSDLLVTK